MTTNGKDDARGDFVQSLARGLSVIRAFDAEHPRLMLSEVAARTGLTRAAARRFLLTLESLGYVRSVDRAFSLTPRVLELGFSYLSALSLPEILQPHLERLAHRLHESVSAAVLDGPDIVYVARVPGRRIMSVAITLGTRFPAYATSMGRVLIAALPSAEQERLVASLDLRPLTERTVTDRGLLAERLQEIARSGYAITDGELEAGMRSAAAPVRGRDGSVVVAVNVSTSTARVSLAELRGVHVPALRETVRDIESDLRLV